MEKTPHPGNGSQAGLCRCFSLIYFIQANPYKHTIVYPVACASISTYQLLTDTSINQRQPPSVRMLYWR